MKSYYENEQEHQNSRKLISKKIKTIQSIGTFNQTPQNFDRSIICKRDIFVNNPFSLPLQEKQKQITCISQISRIQSQVNDISKMKMMYQSRLNNQKNIKIKNKSIEKSIHTKSIEKHVLKPTNTPNFNKFQNRKLTMSPLAHSSYINTQDNALNFSQINCKSSKANYKNSVQQIQLEQGRTTQLKRQSIQLKRQATQQKSQKTSSKKFYTEYSQVSNKFQQYQFQEQYGQKEIFSRSKNSNTDINHNRNIIQKHQIYSNQSSQTPKKIMFSQCKFTQKSYNKQAVEQNTIANQLLIQRKMDEITHKINEPAPIKNKKCSCQQKMQFFIEQTNNKMAQITERLMMLQNQNYRLKMLEEKFIQSTRVIDKLKNKLESIQDQNSLLRESHLSCQTEKQQLQLMLKQILFKRQKQKIHQSSQSSKQNTYRNQLDKNNDTFKKSQHENKNQIDRNYKIEQKIYNKNLQNDFNRKQIQDKFYIKRCGEPLGNRNMNQSSGNRSIVENHNRTNINESMKQKEINAKMKVQNLLSKIQIKIQKN